MLAIIYAFVAYLSPKRIGPARANFHTQIIYAFRVTSLCLTRIVPSQFLTPIVSSLYPFVGTPSCRQIAFYCLLPTAMVAEMARILLELNTGLRHPTSTKIGGVFALASTAIFITTLLDGSSSSSANNSVYITIHIPLEPSILEFTFAVAKLSAAILTLVLSFVARFATHSLNALTLAFRWPRLTCTVSCILYVA